METAVLGRARGTFPGAAWPRLALLVGMLALYLPTFAGMWSGVWREDEYAHGPLILAVSAFLAWRSRDALRERGSAPLTGAGLALVVVGLLSWLLGRTQGLMPIEAGSLLFVASGMVALAWGSQGLRILAFPLAFLLFFVPLPGFILDAATAPLKELVSTAVAHLLAFFGYAVERAGVVLLVDGNELLVADACSGLNSLMSLFALGLLYAHLRGASRRRTLLLAAAVIPIAVVANILRVVALVLLTVHFGPDAADGVMHEALGLSVFVVALLLLVSVDSWTRKWGQVQFRTRPHFAPAAAHAPEMGTGSKLHLTPLIVAVALIATAIAAPVLKPTADPAAAFDLEAAVPASFAGWRIDPDVAPVPPTPDVQDNLNRLYRQIVARTYINDRGESMMLTIAHGGDQSDALKAHRQEVCYRAQGFDIHRIERGSLQAAGRTVDVTRFLAIRGNRAEPVTYWFTMGDRVVLGRLERLKVQLAHGMRGRIPDGLLVRVSSLDTDPARAHAAQAAFAAALATAVPQQHAARLVGAAHS